jgi:hypothetical protein
MGIPNLLASTFTEAALRRVPVDHSIRLALHLIMAEWRACVRLAVGGIAGHSRVMFSVLRGMAWLRGP